MGMLYACDQCGRQAEDIIGWRIVKVVNGPKPLLCGSECVILWEQDQAAKRAATEVAEQPRRRWRWRRRGWL